MGKTRKKVPPQIPVTETKLALRKKTVPKQTLKPLKLSKNRFL